MSPFIPEPDQAQAGGIIRAKWMLDGAETLADAAERARVAAQQLQQLHDAGWTLQAPVEDDYGTLVDPTGNAGSADSEDEAD